MNKLKNFFTSIKRSLTDPSYYLEVVKTSFWSSFRYLFFLLLILTLFSSIKFAAGLTILIPKVPQFIESVKTTSRSLYPTGLVLTLKNGELSTNINKSFNFDIPDLKTIHLATIDTSASPEDYLKANTIFLFTKKSVVVRDQKTSFKIYPYSEFATEGVLTKDIYESFLDKVLPYLNYIPQILYIAIAFAIFVLPFIGSLLWISGVLFYLLLIALSALLLASILKRKLTFSQSYKMAMHAVTLTLLLNFVLGLLTIKLPFLIPTVILLVFIGFILSKLEALKA